MGFYVEYGSRIQTNLTADQLLPTSTCYIMKL